MNKPLKIIGGASPVSGQASCPLFINAVQAGWPSPAEDYIEAEINLHEMVVRNPASTFFIRASGDSMIECGINDGDLLIVDRAGEALHAKIVIASLEGELLVKRLLRKHNKVFLAPANPNYPCIEITNREYVHIWGVVTYVLHKL